MPLILPGVLQYYIIILDAKRYFLPEQENLNVRYKQKKHQKDTLHH